MCIRDRYNGVHEKKMILSPCDGALILFNSIKLFCVYNLQESFGNQCKYEVWDSVKAECNGWWQCFLTAHLFVVATLLFFSSSVLPLHLLTVSKTCLCTSTKCNTMSFSNNYHKLICSNTTGHTVHNSIQNWSNVDAEQ